MDNYSSDCLKKDTSFTPSEGPILLIYQIQLVEPTDELAASITLSVCRPIRAAIVFVWWDIQHFHVDTSTVGTLRGNLLLHQPPLWDLHS